MGLKLKLPRLVGKEPVDGWLDKYHPEPEG